MSLKAAYQLWFRETQTPDQPADQIIECRRAFYAGMIAGALEVSEGMVVRAVADGAGKPLDFPVLLQETALAMDDEFKAFIEAERESKHNNS